MNGITRSHLLRCLEAKGIALSEATARNWARSYEVCKPAFPDRTRGQFSLDQVDAYAAVWSTLRLRGRRTKKQTRIVYERD